MKIRQLSIILVICIMFTMVPTSAFAAQYIVPTKITTNIDSAKPTRCQHTKHDDTCGYNEATEGNATQEELPCDFNPYATIFVSTGTKITLDLSDYTSNYTNDLGILKDYENQLKPNSGITQREMLQALNALSGKNMQDIFTEYSADENMTREQMIIIIYKYAKKIVLATLQAYSEIFFAGVR